MPKPNVTTAKEAAREKDCTQQAIYNALDRGNMSEVRLGGTRLIIKDAKYNAFKVKQTGGRAHKAYTQKHSKG